DRARRPGRSELGAQEEDESEGEDEDEEDVRLVRVEPLQLGFRDRQYGSHRASFRSGSSQAHTRQSAVKAPRMSATVPRSPTLPPPDVTPRPSMKALTGLRARIVPTRPVALIWKKAPPLIPSTTATMDCAIPACSAVRATLVMMNMSDVVAATTRRISTPTATGAPKSTPSNSTEPA